MTLRFSLRFGFVAVSILCVVIAVAAHRAASQRRAVELLRDSGGTVYYDFQTSNGNKLDIFAKALFPRWLIDVVGIDMLSRVVGFDIDESRLSPQRLQELRALIDYDDLKFHLFTTDPDVRLNRRGLFSQNDYFPNKIDC